MNTTGMVTTVRATNVNVAFEEALWRLKTLEPEPEESRNGPVLMFPGPLVTTLTRPRERVMFWDRRDANPFFHLMESLWMLNGRNDVAFPAHFVKRFREFSDDGAYLHGAYGYRWRRHFGFDQIWTAIKMLQGTPGTRRVAIQMWDSRKDLGYISNDIPCNLIAVVDTRGGELNMYVSNRSNDIVWGLYGANAVHFSMLQEFLASALNLPVGTLTTFSVNAHLYTGLGKAMKMLGSPLKDDRYAHLGLRPYPIMAKHGDDDYTQRWEKQLDEFLRRPGKTLDYEEPFFSEVAEPMWRSWEAWKRKDMFMAEHWAWAIEAGDWRTATVEWLERRG